MGVKRSRIRTVLMAVLSVGLLISVAPGAGASGDAPPPEVREQPPSRIVGGSPVSDGQYPYQIAMLVDKTIPGLSGLPTARPGWAQWCGGSIIDPEYVLTASHCVIGFDPGDFRVLAGTRDIQTGGDVIEVDEIIMHPDYDDVTAANDFALFKLSRPVSESLVPIVRPADAALWVAGTMATTTGWGTTSPGGSGSRFMLGVDVPIQPDAECTGAYGAEYMVASMMCAGDVVNGGEDSCQGDSGGPLVVNGPGAQKLQVGVVSWGGGEEVSTWCAHQDFPGVYSRLVNFYNWVKTEVGGEPNDNFAGAVNPTCGVSTDTRSTQFATVEASEPDGSGDVQGGGSLWWKFTAPDHGYININTLGSDFDTRLGLYTGTTVGGLAQMAFNDDINAADNERRSEIRNIHLLDGQTVRIQVDGFRHGDGAGPERGRARVNISFDYGDYPGRQFPDVPESSIFNDDIAWMANEGITTGFAGCNFMPGSQVTRQSMAAFLYRFDGWDRAFHPAPDFTDVSGSHPFYKEIAWMVDEEITTGFPDGSYRPNDSVKRQSMAAFLYRLAGSPNGADPVCTEAPFPDVPISHTFCGEIDWLADTGITGGFPDGNFKPGNDISRQAMATFLSEFPTP